MDFEEDCVRLKTIDNLAVFDALGDKPLDIQSKLECDDTLARSAVEEIGPKTVRVISPVALGTLNGSGFFVGKDGDLVITNSHVVADGRHTTIVTNTGESFRAKIVDIDDLNDLAVLKIEGIKKDPKRSVDIADDNKLKNGDPLLALGHPARSEDLVVSEGLFIEKAPQGMLLQPHIVQNTLRATAAFQVKEPSFAKDVEKYLSSPLLGMDTPLWHGNSGGPVVDEYNRLVGVATAIDPSNPYMTMAQPSSNVKALLDRIDHKDGDKRDQKFVFTYTEQSPYDRDRQTVLGTSAVEIVAAGLLRRFVAPIWGAESAYALSESLPMAAKPNTFVGSGHYLAAAGEQLLGVAGGALSLAPRTRAIGYGLAGASLMLEISHQFRADTAVLTDVSRTSGEKRLPYGWGGKAIQ
ncbi:trypsin-like peptidase domain-containing protein [bacterium]|nr:trypsin-like peptidase domain-containing protein [bacterium]MBP9810718.1 trypsin-like peptidase domain-containing protein [bacterium]